MHQHLLKLGFTRICATMQKRRKHHVDHLLGIGVRDGLAHAAKYQLRADAAQKTVQTRQRSIYNIHVWFYFT